MNKSCPPCGGREGEPLQVLEGKRLFGALYSIALGDLKAVLENSAARKGKTVATTAAPRAQVHGEFREQKRGKRVNAFEGGRHGSIKNRTKLGQW
jgi:hypothetical protein